jgi:putative NADPH-quinone reductase
MSKILVLNGNPKAESFCRALADRYGSAATSAGHQVERLDIAELQMDFAPPDYSDKTKPSADWLPMCSRPSNAATTWLSSHPCGGAVRQPP